MVNAFIKWWAQFVLMGFAAFFVYYMGWFDVLWDKDQTKISMLILGVFLATTLLIGWLAASKTPNHKLENYAWFSGNAMLTLGMIGTVTGLFIMMTGAFESLDVENIQTVKQAIVSLAYGIGTALLTTLTGLVCSLLTQLQLVIYENRL